MYQYNNGIAFSGHVLTNIFHIRQAEQFLQQPFAAVDKKSNQNFQRVTIKIVK